ncbi:MAG: prenyltransferase/squalene oxidase repeat-containing protein [Verrucomicrobiota bacterium]
MRDGSSVPSGPRLCSASRIPAAARWRAFICSVFLAAFCLTAAEAPPADRVDAAVQRGVDFLIKQQNREGAMIDPDRGNQYQTVMTGLSVLAMAAVGHQPADKTPQGVAMRRAIDFLLRVDRQRPDGYFGNEDSSRMYGHGIISLALTEMLGMGVDKNQDKLIRDRAVKAIELILRSQRVRKHSVRFDGGWRYTPESGDSDLSVSVWQLMALRSAKNAGMAVPKESIDQAVDYLKRSYASNRDASGKPTEAVSGFAYQPGGGAEFATTAAGLLALQVCGEYSAPEVIGASEWLLDLTDTGRRGRRMDYSQRWFFYGMYYYAQGMQKRGGEHARAAKQFTERILLDNQLPDGSWLSGDGQERNAGRVYSTSLAILSLAVKYHFLPIYQN